MEPATTEIYRSLHPLSLHDALPISPAPSLGAVEREPLRRLDRTGTLVHQHHRQPVSRLQFTRERVGALADRLVAAVERHRITNHQAVRPPFGVQAVDRLPVRSEEHTSELQSLMRTSYAVFCLKKKQHEKTQ